MIAAKTSTKAISGIKKAGHVPGINSASKLKISVLCKQAACFNIALSGHEKHSLATTLFGP